MKSIEAISLIEKMISLAIIFQTIELVQLKEVTQRVWNWKTVQREFLIFPSFIQVGLNHLLEYPNFSYLLIGRICAAVFLVFFPHPAIVAFLFVSTTLISLRWRGTFNGGSDFMTLIVLMCLLTSSLFSQSPKVGMGCLWYISIQTCTSYFIGGLTKLKKLNWRSGRAIPGFIRTSIYPASTLTEKLLNHSKMALIVSWLVLLFECSFPLALLNPTTCSIYIGIALVFHLGNVYLFGLNRFFWAWISAYPALYFCSLRFAG